MSIAPPHHLPELTLLLETITTLVWTASANGTITWVNRAASVYRGRPASELLGDAMWRAVHPDDHAEVMAQWRRVLSTGAPLESEARLVRHDGVYRWHVIRAVAARDASGAISTWCGTATDVDEHKRMETQRDQLIGLLRSRNFELQRFAYAVTHDVKAPLRAISSLASWIAEDLGASATPEIAASLAAMQTRTTELAVLVEGMLRDAVAGHAARQPAAGIAARVHETVSRVAPELDARARLDDLPALVASVAALVETHGASVAVEETPAGGATVSFRWPPPGR